MSRRQLARALSALGHGMYGLSGRRMRAVRAASEELRRSMEGVRRHASAYAPLAERIFGLASAPDFPWHSVEHDRLDRFALTVDGGNGRIFAVETSPDGGEVRLLERGAVHRGVHPLAHLWYLSPARGALLRETERLVRTGRFRPGDGHRDFRANRESAHPAASGRPDGITLLTTVRSGLRLHEWRVEAQGKLRVLERVIYGLDPVVTPLAELLETGAAQGR